VDEEVNQDKIGEADGMNLEVEIKLKNGIGSRSQVGCSNCINFYAYC